jgi:NUDIX domain-containing protein
LSGNPADVRQPARELDHLVELLLIAAGPPLRVVEVLPSAGRVSADRLDVAHRMRTDPDLLPGRRDDELADALEHLRVVDALAVCVEIFESTATPPASDARTGTVGAAESGHCGLFPPLPSFQPSEGPPRVGPLRQTSSVRAIVPLDSEPRFRPFPFVLPADAPLERAIRDAERLLSRTPGRFDGPIAFCHGVSPEGAVLRRSGRYAEAIVVFQEPSLAYRLGFALGVQLFVERPEGAVLFQLRGPSIGRDPLLWTASASGGLRPGEEPRAAVLADAEEEIGLGERDLEDVRPVAVCVNDDSGSALVVYHARLRAGGEPVPDDTKVAELHWATEPGDIGAQISGDTIASWEALERWRESMREGASATPGG